jgi:hypothetical protein
MRFFGQLASPGGWPPRYPLLPPGGRYRCYRCCSPSPKSEVGGGKSEVFEAASGMLYFLSSRVTYFRLPTSYFKLKRMIALVRLAPPPRRPLNL